MKEITIDIDRDGNVRIETSGFEGKECKTATEALERLLLTGDTKTEWKAEARQARPTARKTRA